jgi:hypothetical protein
MKPVLALIVTICTMTLSLSTTWAESELEVPFQYGAGLEKYQSLCAECHGQWAAGTDKGPTLIHPYYVPSHHSDRSFFRAILQGAPMHHWEFGDMPPVEGASEQDAINVIIRPVVATVPGVV